MVIRAVSITLASIVTVLAFFPIFAAFMPTDGDYSETVTVEYTFRGETITLDVPAEESPFLIHKLSRDFYCRFVMADDPAVMALASTIESMSDGTDFNKVELALDFVHNRIEYASDDSVHCIPDYWQLPTETLRLGTGDCEDFTLLFVSIVKAMGLDSVIVLEPGHVMAGVYIEGLDALSVEHKGVRYATVDPTNRTAIGLSTEDVISVLDDDPTWRTWGISVLFAFLTAVVYVLCWKLVRP